MRGTLKTTTLEAKFPLLAVEQDCILSKNADITAAFRVTLPELFTVTSAEYEAIMVERFLLPASAGEGCRCRISDEPRRSYLWRDVRRSRQRHRRQRLGAREALLGERVQYTLWAGAEPGRTAIAAVCIPLVAGELSALASCPGDFGTVRHASLRGAAAGTAAKKEKEKTIILKIKNARNIFSDVFLSTLLSRWNYNPAFSRLS